ncbi:MAG: ribbon-helix-helix domain-containing protein [Planktomarina sp.]|nr:ribbon-helix-helix domain-containing protein [Planktomarina sp.]
MMQRPQKRSLTLNGHRTSVSLEDEFWQEFLRIAQDQGKAINALAVEIDHARGVEIGLASAFRLFVLSHALGRPFP